MAACRMSEIFYQHTPVLLREVIENMMHSPDGVYIDATYGRGSHAQAILEHLNSDGRLIAFDKDPEAVRFAEIRHSGDKRFNIYHRSFNQLEITLNSLQLIGAVQGILFDLGVSSPQLDNPIRGFSFRQDAPLDMRMDTTKGTTAREWLAKVKEEELADVLWRCGEEKFSRRIARAIVKARTSSPIITTKTLTTIIQNAVPRMKKDYEKHPATRSFQAIRIFINQELNELQQGLEQALRILTPGGRLAVISFHSLEDRIVKQFILKHEKGEKLPHKLPVKEERFRAQLKTVNKLIRPSVQEINVNPRARSATLRIAEKLL